MLSSCELIHKIIFGTEDEMKNLNKNEIAEFKIEQKSISHSRQYFNIFRLVCLKSSLQLRATQPERY